MQADHLAAGQRQQVVETEASVALAQVTPHKTAKERAVNRFTLGYVSDLFEKTGGNITRAAELARNVQGVTTVKNDMRLK